jgi:glycosyltransferase involved in cell wall biosynthesis
MKIACITTSVIPSNTANSIQAMKVCHALKEIGSDVRLWVPAYQRADWQDLADIYGLQSAFPVDWLPFIPALRQYDFCWRAVQEACRWGADVVYTWSLQAADFALMRAKPAVMEFHDFPMGKFGPRLFHKYISHSGRKLTLCTTRALADGLEENYQFHFRDDELQIAPNGVELERYAQLPEPAAARRLLGLKEKLTVGYSGHFYSGRGMDILLELAKALPQANFLWMGGRLEDITPWQEKLTQLNLNNVTITGFIPNSQLPMYQAAADILLMPYSRSISGSSGGNIARIINPMKMFDYLASGRAIAASDIPVFHEVLSDQNVLFCEPENPQGWIKAVTTLLQDEKLRIRLGSQAKQDASRYAWKQRARTTLEKLQIQLQ